MSLTWLIVLYLGVALAASRIPFVRVYQALCHTLMEEVIRVLVSCCFKGGRYSKIKLYRNGSGQTIHQVDSKFKKAVIEYAGYTGTSLAAIGLFFLVSRGYNHLIIYLFIGLAALSLLLWIRTLFGAAWGLSFVFLLGVPVFFGKELVMLHLSILLSAVILTQLILKAFQLLQRSFHPAGDGSMKRAGLLPPLVWSLVLMGQSLLTGYLVLIQFL